MSIIPFLNDKHIRLHTFDNRNIVTVALGLLQAWGEAGWAQKGELGLVQTLGGWDLSLVKADAQWMSTQSKFTFTFMHLADAFIQSDLQYIQVIHFFCQYVCSLGIEPTTFALLTQCSTTEQQEHSLSK